ncbi:MAG: 50S ribosomal protein L21 [Candidatus Peribacteraceae bacterium]|nr:50S ribosomal protein L21 [Candidatus Peribacteraceae bacterium]
MFAVVDITGFQEIVEKGQVLKVQHIDVKEGETVKIDKVLLVSDGTDVSVGKPYVTGASVSLKVLKHGKGDKIVVRKFKRRKRYHKILRGHRQLFTEVEVTGIVK